MNRKLMVPLVMLLLMMPFIPMALASTLIDSYGTANTSDLISMVDTHPSGTQVSAVGQSFINVYTMKLYSVKFYLSDGATSPDGDLIAALYVHSGVYGAGSVPTGAALATSAPIAATTIGGPNALYEFLFTGANQYVMQPNIKYCIAVYRTATAAQVDVMTDQTAPSHSGNTFRYNAGAWGAINTEDTIFYLYGVDAYGSGDGTYGFYFDNAIYENNTDAGLVNVTSHSVNGTETFPVDAGTWYYSPMMPEAFSWSIGAATRWIYTPDIENFTVTLPYDTYAIYSITVKDYTGKIGDGDSFLEAYRDIGGVETLIERQIIHPGNVVPMSLMVGSVYRLRILFDDGTRYDWGNFVAGSTTTLTVIVRAVEFTDQAQILYNDIHVEATRPTPYTTITVDYLDDLNMTVWANVTIRVRNGAVAVNEARNNATYTYNWAAALANTSYVVTVEGEHTEYGVWGYSKIFDATPTFPAPPSLTGIFGGVSPDLLAYLITVISLITFSKALQARGLMATMFVASVLSFIGWASWTWEYLVFGWFIAITAALTMGGSE